MALFLRIVVAVIRRIRRFFLRLLFPDGMKPGLVKFYVSPLLPIKFECRHMELTLLHSIDTPYEPSAHLIEQAFAAARLVPGLRLRQIDERLEAKRDLPDIAKMRQGGFDANIWPGEHYRLLAALVCTTRAKRVIEIGTYWGMGALAMAEKLSDGGQVISYDVIPWDAFPETLLCEEDFSSQRILQVVGDLQQAEFFRSQRQRFEEADLIFMDAAKDGVMERTFLKHFYGCKFRNRPLLVIDDIRLWNMLDIWAGIELPKIDLSGFGHYTGTGLVDLASPRK